MTNLHGLCSGRSPVSVAALVLLASVFTTSLVRAETLTYTEAHINSATSVADGDANDTTRDDTGADVQNGVAGTASRAFGAGTTFVVKSVTDDVFAQASLATGALKSRAVLHLGNNTFVSGGGIGLGTRNGAASASAEFADSFRAYSGSRPFLWASDTTVQFRFGITGQTTVTGSVPDPVDRSAGQPLNEIYTFLRVALYKPGTIDLLRQMKDFDFSAYPDFASASAAFSALTAQIQANFIGADYRYFGDFIAPFDEDAAHVLAVDPTTPVDVTFTFTPGGDFDWVASLTTNVFLDAALQSVGATLDFANTVVTAYGGPPGTTTYSGSGLFPNTLALTDAPEATACPRTAGFWKNNPTLWPVTSLTLGGKTYTKADALKVLGRPGGGDASVTLAIQLIAAKLNVASGADEAPIDAAIASGDAALGPFAGQVPYNVKTNSAAGKTMLQIAATLESYNKQLLTPSCQP